MDPIHLAGDRGVIAGRGDRRVRGPDGARGVRLGAAGLTKRFDTATVLSNLDLDVPAGGRVSVLGASGSGKTTLLRLLAGLDVPDEGTVTIEDRACSGPGWATEPHRRGMGFAFQRSALWPHMTVARNILFGVRGLSPEASRERLATLLEELELGGLAERYPDQISGGQARRVALARAMAPDPAVLLFDEPLTNLDADLKARVLARVRERTARSGATIVYVTHDDAEARAMADRVLHLARGRLEPTDGARSRFDQEVAECSA